MKSLFDEKDRTKIIARINELGSYSTPEWGKMDVAQMLTHCKKFFTTAYGGGEASDSWTAKLLGSNSKDYIINNMAGFKKNLETSPQFRVQGTCNFDEAKKELLALLERIAREGPAGLGNAAHPFFGPLTAEEWGILMWKHLDHHLKQFNV